MTAKAYTTHGGLLIASAEKREVGNVKNTTLYGDVVCWLEFKEHHIYKYDLRKTYAFRNKTGTKTIRFIQYTSTDENECNRVKIREYKQDHYIFKRDRWYVDKELIQEK
jgi:hypothetical protein